MRSYVYAGALLGFVASNGPAMAWGDLGHEVVCEIAFRELNPQARSKVTSLIALDPEFRAFGKSCTWPDGNPRIRPPEHFANLSRAAKKIEVGAPCSGAARCVVTAIANDMHDLAVGNDEMDQLRLLKSLGHWIGDIHQPLHISFEDDKGANKIDVDAPCDSNLHSVWDSCILETKIGQHAREIAIDLRGEITPQKRAEWVPGDIDMAAIVGWATNPSRSRSTRMSSTACKSRASAGTRSTRKRILVAAPRKRSMRTTPTSPSTRQLSESGSRWPGVRLAAVLNTAFGQVALAEATPALVLRAREPSVLSALDRGRAPMVAISVEQWQALLFRLDRLEGALQAMTQELRSLRADRQPAPARQ